MAAAKKRELEQIIKKGRKFSSERDLFELVLEAGIPVDKVAVTYRKGMDWVGDGMGDGDILGRFEDAKRRFEKKKGGAAKKKTPPAAAKVSKAPTKKASKTASAKKTAPKKKK